jgi:hypothetical protein
MSAQRPTAAEKRTSPDLAYGPKAAIEGMGAYARVVKVES